MTRTRNERGERRVSLGGIALLLLLFGCATPSSLAQEDRSITSDGDRRITFDQILDGRVRYGGGRDQVRFDAEGAAISVGGEWTSVATGEPAQPAAAPSTSPAAAEGLVDADWPDGAPRLPRGGRQFSANGEIFAAASRAGVFFREAGKAGTFAASEMNREYFTLAPSGAHASWVNENDLYVIDRGTMESRALTSGGGPDLFHGKLDWVYQEEIYGRGNYRGHWWSSGGEYLAYLRLDETEVPSFSIIDHVPARQRSTALRYPKAGDPNPIVSAHVWSVAENRTIEVDLSSFGKGNEILVVRVDWHPERETLYLQIQDRIQTWLELLEVDPRTGEWTSLLREESKSWVNVLGAPRWLDDGERFLWRSERSGFQHLYLYGRGEARAITRGDWEVRRVLAVDEERREIWFSASIPSPVESHAYRVSFDGGEIVQLTSMPGSHSITIAPDRNHFIDRFSSHRDPGQTILFDRDGRPVRVLGKSNAPALDNYAYSWPTRHTIPNRDGYEMEAMVFLPTDFDEKETYPVWLMTYSGPDAPTVRDRWQSDPWKQFLCQQGMIVLQVNNRSSSGRGQVDTAVSYRQLGVTELRDLEDAVDWITANPWADANRVGITGWSYGGFMAAYALTNSKKFALGIAGAGVYDWRLYDTIYTERYMQTPEMNPEGYQVTSVVENAANLTGHLLIVHGMDDDNVHVQNAMQLSRALQKAGKKFDLMLYPTATHGIRDRQQRRHHRSLEWDTIQEHLLRAPEGVSRGNRSAAGAGTR